MENGCYNLTNCSGGTDDFYFEHGVSWALWVKEVITPIIVIVGILGNVLSFVVMSSRPLRHKSYSFYLRALAIFDSLTLINRELHVVDELHYVYQNSSLFQNFGVESCKMLRFVEGVCCLMSSWLVVLMSVERFVAIYFPWRKTAFCTKRRALAAILFLFIVICCCQIHVLIMMGHSRGTCNAVSIHRDTYLRLYIYLYLLVLILVLPVGLIVFSNTMVICKIFRYRQIASDNSTEKNDEKAKWITQRRHKTTYMLITITSAYIVTLLPIALCSVVIHISIRYKAPMEAYKVLMTFEPYKHILEIWSSLNYGLNFFIYILSGKMFRRELRRVLKGRIKTGSNALKTRSTNIKEEIVMSYR